MKHLCITYRLSVDRSEGVEGAEPYRETAETCITLPMLDKYADDILKNQENSRYVQKGSEVRTILEQLTILQDYSGLEFVCAEHDKRWKKFEE